MRLSAVVVWAMLAVGLVACFRDEVAVATPAASIPVIDLTSLDPIPTPVPSEPPASALVTPTPIELTPTDPHTPTPAPSQLTFATPAPDCVEGWTSLAPGSAEYEDALSLLEGQMGVAGPWLIDEMRYFTGPEMPHVEPQYPSVERWYIKGALEDDPAFRGRWIVERRTDLIAGISAVATYDSTGYESPDWTGFVGEGPPTSYLGLPGQWSGIPYDFVTGEGDSGQPGLPDEVVGCLAGT